MTEALKREIFEFLDGLRDSGEVNMFGAVPYVAANFFISKHEARQMLAEWMKGDCKKTEQKIPNPEKRPVNCPLKK